MSVIPWLVAAAGAVLAALAAVSDGALLSDAPTMDTPESEGLLSASTATSNHVASVAALPARERQHRALAFTRLLGHGVTGGAIAIALELGSRTEVSAVVVLVLTGLLTVSVAESVARAVGDALGERAATKLAPFARMTERVMSPLVLLGEQLDRILAAAMPDDEDDLDRREEAASQFREVVSAEVDVSSDERDLLLGVFSFGETTVGEVMVPRVDVLGVERSTPWSEVVDHVRSAQHSRIPVYEETIDEIVGVLYAKDLLGSIVDDVEPAEEWTSLIRPAAYIPTTKRIADLLRDFKSSRQHIAIVADEYGGTAGLVTIEDILEELVGEIRDEYDDEERSIEVEFDQRYWVSGRITLEDLSESVGHDFTRDDVTTVGGLVLELVGRVPRAGQELNVDGFRWIVERVVRRKVERVFIERPQVRSGETHMPEKIPGEQRSAQARNGESRNGEKRS
ncbi:MAG: hemolysin family protein [Gemmatimonadaceae bacterium]